MRWRQLSRAVVAEVIERTIDEWRRPESATAGALLWLWRDLWPGAGWGLVDSDGRPKSAVYALRRASLPLRLSITDEGTNGLYLHLVNDTPHAVTGRLTLRCLKDGAIPVIAAARDVAVAAHAGLSIGAFDLFDRFFDAGHCYRFGPASHDVVHATFEMPTAGQPVEAFHFIGIPAVESNHAVNVVLGEDRSGFFLELQTDTTARFVEIVDDGFVPDDNYFHLAPGRKKVVRFTPSHRAGKHVRPAGRVAVLGENGEVNY
jgi:beta-mannosidase